MYYQIHFDKNWIQPRHLKNEESIAYWAQRLNNTYAWGTRGSHNDTSNCSEQSSVWKTKKGVDTKLDLIVNTIKRFSTDESGKPFTIQSLQALYQKMNYRDHRLRMVLHPKLKDILDKTKWTIVETEKDPTYISPIQIIPKEHKDHYQIMNTNVSNFHATRDMWCVKCKHGVPEGLFVLAIDIKSVRSCICASCLTEIGDAAMQSIKAFSDQEIIGQIATNRLLHKL